MIKLKKNEGEQTISITINDVKITISIGEWSKLIAREGTCYGLVQKVV